MSLHYGWEKFFKAVYSAVTSNASLQKRLANICIYNISHVHKEDVPPEIWSRVETLMTAVTSKPAIGDEGKINATTCSMSDEEAAKLLEEVVTIFNSIAEAHYGQKRI